MTPKKNNLLAEMLSQGRPYDLQEIADAMGLSKSRVEQIEKQALAKLRLKLRPEDYTEFLSQQKHK